MPHFKFSALFGNNSGVPAKMDSSGVPAKKSKRYNRICRIEELESRELLSVTVADFKAICTQYADYDFGNYADYNFIEVGGKAKDAKAFSLAGLQSALSDAAATNQNDLIVVRTTSQQCVIELSGSQIAISTNAAMQGSITIVSLGTYPLTINAKEMSRAISVSTFANVVLAGLTITGGKATGTLSGGGISNDGTLTIVNCTISNNQSLASGGPDYKGGGGISNNNTGTLTVLNSTISDNTANYGGGIRNNGILTITNSTMTHNEANSAGGGVFDFAGTLRIIGSTISYNRADTNGGGMNLEFGGTATINGSIIASNGARYGGGICQSGGNVTVNSSVIVSNNASNEGGGLYAATMGSTALNNVTIMNNWSYAKGGGICNASGPIDIKNSIIADNRVWVGTENIWTQNNVSTTTTLYYSLVDNTGMSGVGGKVPVYSGTGNRTGVDPKFNYVGGNWADFDLRLALNSPAVNKGNAGLISSNYDRDVLGGSLLNGGQVSMGAYPPVPLGTAVKPKIKVTKTATTITLTWMTPKGKTLENNAFYKIVCTPPKKSGSPPTDITVGGLQTSCTFTDVMVTMYPNSSYKFTVTAINAEGQEAKKVTITAKTKTHAAVAQLKMSKMVLGSATVTWDFPKGVKADDPAYQSFMLVWLTDKNDKTGTPINYTDLVISTIGGKTTGSMKVASIDFPPDLHSLLSSGKKATLALRAMAGISQSSAAKMSVTKNSLGMP